MLYRLKYLSLVLIIQFSSSSLFSQNITITKMKIVNDQMHINYTIDDSNPNNEYLVTVLSSKNNFSAPHTNVSGDVGQDVKPGNRVAIWNLKEELGDYKGPLSIELRANVFIPFVRLKGNEESHKVFKRGKNYELKWRPGNTNPVHIELFKDDQKLGGQLNHPNNGSFSTLLSKDLKRGDYKMKLSDAKHPEDFVYTSEFLVKRKIPLAIKVIPFIALGVLGSQLFLNSGESGSNSAPPLPDPPSLPGN